jgi:F-type H+-transporting ATPase subunit delta
MLAASRESYAAAVDALNEYAAGATPERLTATGDEVLAVAELLRREPRLRRALADASRDPDERAGLLGAVFGDRIGDETLGLLTALVRGRWSAPGELLDSVERIGAETLLAGAEQANELGDVEDELFRFGHLVSGNRQLAGVLSDSTADLGRRERLTADLLEGKVKPASLRLVTLALRGFGGRGFDASLSRLVELAAARRDRQVAYVTTAAPLNDAEEERLAGRLTELYGRQISLKVDVDPSVVGGVRVQVGADLYDGTVSRRLNEARKALAG